MDLSRFRKVAEKNRIALDKKAEEEKKFQKEKEAEEKRLKFKEIEDKALEIFNKIPLLCERAAERGEFRACVFSIESNERNSNVSRNCQILNHLIKLLKSNNILWESKYRFVEDMGYGEDYIKIDESYDDYYVMF